MAFELGDNRIIHADEVAFCDLCIAAKFAPITLRKVPVYILPGESGNEILLGRALGIASPKDLLDQLSQECAKDIRTSEFHEEEALNQLFQVMNEKYAKCHRR